MKTITAAELKKLIEQNNVTLIDVREPAEHKSECIECAHLIPLADISHRKLPLKTGPIVIHCHSGKRSAEACKKLLAQHPDLDLYSLEGGIVAWKDAGSATKRMGGKMLPLDRQTQLAAGLLSFSGVILGTFINPAFYLLSGFVGAGLMFAGLTGWCGMAKLLAKMPWNQ